MKKAIKWIFLSLTILVNALTVIESCLPGDASGSRSSFWSNLLAIFINSTGDGKVEKIPLQDLDFNLKEITQGETIRVDVSYLPSNTTEKGVSFITSSKSVNLVQVGDSCYIEGLTVDDDVSIIVKSTSGTNIKKSKKTRVLERKTIPLFDINKTEKIVKKGLTTPIVIDNIKDKYEKPYKDIFDAYRTNDASKLLFKSSNESVATIKEGLFIYGVNEGEVDIYLSTDETIRTTISVIANEETLLYPNSDWSIVGNSVSHVYDYDYKGEFYSQLEIDWKGNIPSDTNIKWSVEDENVLRIFQDGKCYGYKKSGKTIVTATSLMDGSEKTFEVVVNKVLPETFSIKNIENSVIREVGSQFVISEGNFLFTPKNVTDKSVSISSSDKSVCEVYSEGRNVRLNPKKRGKCTIKITSNADESLSKSFSLEVIHKKIINEDNKNDFNGFVRKSIGHFLLFGVNACLTTITLLLFLKPKMKEYFIVIISLAFGLVIASLTETIQYFVPGRSGLFKDVGIDMLGYTIFLSLLYLVILLSRFIKKRMKNNRQK